MKSTNLKVDNTDFLDINFFYKILCKVSFLYDDSDMPKSAIYDKLSDCPYIKKYFFFNILSLCIMYTFLTFNI